MTLNALPAWSRWVLLLPAAMAGAFVVGNVVDLVNSSSAATPDAPIVYIARFLSSLVSYLVFFRIAYELAPKHELTVVAVLVVLAGVESSCFGYLYIRDNDSIGLALVAGNLVACVVEWRGLVRRKRKEKEMQEWYERLKKLTPEEQWKVLNGDSNLLPPTSRGQ